MHTGTHTSFKLFLWGRMMEMPVQKPHILLLASFVVSLLAAGCGSSSSGQSATSSSSQAQEINYKTDYNNTKTMVMDILHTKEGKEGLKDIFKDPTFKQALSINEHDVNQALTKSITSGANKNLIEAQMKDPIFANALVKASKKEHQEMLKALMKDPEYQNDMLTLLKSPSYQQTLIPLMQTPEYRQTIMKIMLDSLQNPEFKLIFMETIKDAIRSGAGVSKPSASGQGAQTLNSGGNANSKDQASAQKKSSSSSGQNQEKTSSQNGSDQEKNSGQDSTSDSDNKTSKKDASSDGQESSDNSEDSSSNKKDSKSNE